MDLQFTHKGINVLLMLGDKVCVVIADAAAGKTFMARLLQEYGTLHGIDVRLYTAESKEEFIKDKDSWGADTIVIMDYVSVWGDYDYQAAKLKPCIEESEATFLQLEQVATFIVQKATLYTFKREGSDIIVIPKRYSYT